MLNNNRSERAIIVLDMINKYAHKEGSSFESSALDIIAYVQGEVQYFRERFRPVIFANTAIIKENPSEADAFDQQVVQAMSPRSGEIILEKNRPNGFFDTKLATMLRSLKVKNLTIVGAFSHGSVAMTTVSALDHGFSVVVPETCICGNNADDHAAALRLISLWLNDDK